MLAVGPHGEGVDFWGASAKREAPALTRLARDDACEVAIVGGGFTGLSAAYELAKAGISAVVLEAGDLGRGASGRNAGMAGTRYKLGWAALAATYGTSSALRLHALMREAHAALHELLEACSAADALDISGQLIPAHAQMLVDELGRDADWLRSELGDTSVRILDARETAFETGATCYRGAWLDPRGGAVMPLDLLRAAAARLVASGQRIHTYSEVVRIEPQGAHLHLVTRSATLRAAKVILATNAYTPSGLIEPDLSRHLVPVASSVLATAPLPAAVLDSILPNGRVASDTRRLLHAFRRLPGGRLLFSGRADITGRRASEAQSYAGLEQAMRETFPQVGNASIDYRWAGFVGVSRDGFPHLGRLGDRIIYAMGYSGRGVVLAHLLGRHAARMALGEQVVLGPMDAAGFRPWPLHRLRVPAMRALTWLHDRRDRRDAARDPVPQRTV